MFNFAVGRESLLSGFQWFFFIFCNTVVVPPTLLSAFQLPQSSLLTLTQYAFLATALACFAQAFCGHRRAIMEGPGGLWWGTILTITLGEASRGTPINDIATSLAVGIALSGVLNHSSLVNGGPRKISPFFVPSTIVNMVAGHLTIMFGLRGPSISIATACTSGVHNIGQAARIIAYGDADAMVAGGAEKASTPLGVGGFGAARALSTRNDNPQAASRPWDKDRDGFVLGDGAGMVVLEEYEHAKKRGAKIYAEIVGFGMSSDAYHMTSPPEDGAGAALAMVNAIRDAGIEPGQIGYVNAHGTSTPAGDKAEAQAVKSVFGDAASRVLVSSTKSMTGHLLGAAGAVESIYSILALRDQAVPPTINLDNPDEGCDLDFVPHEARQVSGMEYTLCNSFGFGGTNGSLIFKKV